jgi:DNA-binding winged helix-turn-helix (wHTH) protein
MHARARFGEFVLDDGEKQLLRAGRPVHLTPKAYALLRYVVDQGHRALSRAEILQHLWPATFVSEGALTSVVKELRHALGDPAHEPHFIRSVRGFGYAFCGELVVDEADGEPLQQHQQAPSGPEFRLFWQNREIALVEGEHLLGRTREAAVWVDDSSVSRRHAILRVAGSRATLEDCGSKNGTYIRGVRLTGPRELDPGDEFWLGSACLVFACYANEVATSSASLSAAPGPAAP